MLILILYVQLVRNRIVTISMKIAVLIEFQALEMCGIESYNAMRKINIVNVYYLLYMVVYENMFRTYLNHII